jgi:two-component system, cell cycle sensor histidine kinase and response regulator CckA
MSSADDEGRSLPGMKGEPISEQTRAMRLLLAGPREEDYFLIRDLLAQHASARFELDHALTRKDATERLETTAYDLVLLQQESSNELLAAVLGALRGLDRAMPLLVLTEHADEQKLVEAVRGSFCEYISRDELEQGTFLRTVRWANDLHRREQQFGQTLQKLHSAVEQSADIVIITDAQARIEYVNPAFERTTGYARAEVIGSTPRLLKSGEHNPAFYDELWRTLKAGEVFRGVMINRKKSGESLVVDKTITPVRNGLGEVTHFISNDRDISEVRRLETALFQAHKMDAIGQLAGGVAHDFNNLLMVISSYAELMLDHVPPEHKLHRNVQQILGASRRAADLTRQLLAFGRKQMQTLQIVDLNNIVQGIARFLPRLIGEDIDLKIVAAEELGRVHVDPGQIEQVLMNLAANARDAMPDGGVLTIETRNIELDETYVHAQNLVRPGEYVLLEVTDSGTGIPPEHLPHIFEPFYTTKEQGKGTGLGLATVYGIVKQSGGYIWVYSEKNLGTAFKIYFPRVRKQATPQTEASPRAIEDVRGTETILVVEDEQPVRSSLCECLRNYGYTVLDAGCGTDALALAKDHKDPIHLMISDMVMPGMSGWQVAEALSAIHSETKVLFVSGYAEQVVNSRINIHARDGFLQKPFTLRALALKVRDVLKTNSAAAGARA